MNLKATFKTLITLNLASCFRFQLFHVKINDIKISTNKTTFTTFFTSYGKLKKLTIRGTKK